MQKNRVISDEIMTTIQSKEGMTAVEWIAEQMPGGFFIYRADESMELLYVNQSTCEIYGCETVKSGSIPETVFVAWYIRMTLKKFKVP